MGWTIEELGSIPGMAGDSSLRHSFQTGSGTHPGYPVGTYGSSAGGKTVRA
jgi:hypothetical protein